MPIKSKRLKGAQHNEVMKIVRERIVTGNYQPGTKLVENDLIEEFGVSRSIIGSVFKTLEIECLVERQANKGTAVRKIDFATLIEIMEIRQFLESMAARLAAQKTVAEDWKDLYAEFGQPLENSVEKLDFERYFFLIAEFRHRMLTAAQNSELSKLANSLLSKIQIVQRRIIILPGRIKEAIHEHREVLKAIMNGNPDEAERLKRLNLKNAADCLKKYEKWIF